MSKNKAYSHRKTGKNSSRTKSENSHGYVYVDIRKRNPNRSYENSGYVPDNVNSEFLKQAGQNLLQRNKRNRNTFKYSIRSNQKK